ncbi:class I SAM-dependent methyltransferase [Acinetobacter sp. WZC-1]|uniref:class I SAM-dependent methyltransferase n=1 Tax=Acinetobacter sp. WZC-1 TaxID=3459034 RepID=UPI00403D5990
MKDLFSDHSLIYQQARPGYPQSVIQEILKYVPAHNFAWDCGAGSGQFTQLLVPYFDDIVATDLSASQLQQAPYFENVSYQVQSAEQTTFADQSFDLITVAQAIHWFNFDAFYREVKRTLKPEGLFAAIGYGLICVKNQHIDELVQQLYFHVLKDYWDAERHYIDQAYQTIPFPFNEIHAPVLNMHYQWSAAQLLKYLSTWSAVQHYQKHNQVHPLLTIAEHLENHAGELTVEFPVLLRLGKV